MLPVEYLDISILFIGKTLIFGGEKPYKGKRLKTED
jgi:hypothetical protein